MIPPRPLPRRHDRPSGRSPDSSRLAPFVDGTPPPCAGVDVGEAMRFRGKSIRRKIVALLLVPLVSLMSLWAFATYITGREANQLLDVGNVVKNLGYPVEDVIQHPPRGAPAEPAVPRRPPRRRRARRAPPADPGHRRGRQPAARRHPTCRDVREDLSDGAGDRHGPASSRAWAHSASLRAQVEDNTVSRDEAMEATTPSIDPGYDFLAALHALENVEMDKQAPCAGQRHPGPGGGLPRGRPDVRGALLRQHEQARSARALRPRSPSAGSSTAPACPSCPPRTAASTPITGAPRRPAS